MSLRQNIKALGLAAALAALTGCISVLPEASAPPDRYALNAPTNAGFDAPQASWTLIVERPTASRALDNARIAMRRTPMKYEYAAGAEWTDRAPVLVQSLLVRGFENSGKIMGVSSRAAGAKSEYALLTDMRRFEVRYDAGAPEVHVAFYMKLIRAPGGAILDARLIEARAPASRGVSGIVEAFDAAAGEAVSEAIDWALTAPRTDSQS